MSATQVLSDPLHLLALGMNLEFRPVPLDVCYSDQRCWISELVPRGVAYPMTTMDPGVDHLPLQNVDWQLCGQICETLRRAMLRSGTWREWRVRLPLELEFVAAAANGLVAPGVYWTCSSWGTGTVTEVSGRTTSATVTRVNLQRDGGVKIVPGKTGADSSSGLYVIISAAYDRRSEGLEKQVVCNPVVQPKQEVILFLGANPPATERLRQDKEYREIDEALNRAVRRNKFILKCLWAVQYQDVQRSMLDLKPSIVHFSGHGTSDNGLCMEDIAGQSHYVPGETLAKLFKIASDHVSVVILNCCSSYVLARTISQYIEYVVGMPGALNDQAAIAFSRGFYDALGAGALIELAFSHGNLAMGQSYSQDAEPPQLFMRGSR